MAAMNEVAAALMEHLCEHAAHGYTQGNRWGNGKTETVKVDGKNYKIALGDRDCSSAVISAYKAAGLNVNATYTGNMKNAFLATGLFEWKPMSFSAQRGDIYLNESNHTAMCVSPYGSKRGDLLAEFSISENGTIYGKEGDSTGKESWIHAYYDYPWDGILHFKGTSTTTTKNTTAKTATAAKKSVTDIAKEVLAGKWGNGSTRTAKLKAAGYDPAKVQAEVNKQIKNKSIDAIAREVIAGKWGNGANRTAKLKAAGYDPTAVQKRVNALLK